MDNTDDSSNPPQTTESSSADELALISEQRAALEDVIKISLAITNLQKGLNAVLLLGKESSKIPKAYLQRYDLIKTGIMNQPSTKLKESLEILDNYINNAIQNVMEIVDQGEQALVSSDSSSFTLGDIHENIHNEIEDFKRKSQTAVVIRLLLRERGIGTKELPVSVPKEVLTAKITELDKKEKTCRKRIHKELKVMDGYVTNVLDNPGLPDAIKQEMLATRASIQMNIEHLETGKTIDKLPVVFDIVEMGSEEDHKYAFTPTSLLPEAPSDTESTSKSEDPFTVLKRRSFFSRLYEWATTPMGVSWKDIDKYK